MTRGVINEDGREREQMRHCAAVMLKDGENTSVSTGTRLSAIFDSICIRLMLSHDGPFESNEHPSIRVILSGAEAAELDDESVEEVLTLYSAVVTNRYKLWTHEINLLQAIALARHIADLVKR